MAAFETSSASFSGRRELHNRPSSIHHWQLRDLISAADTEDELFCVDDRCIIQYNTTTRTSTVRQSLDFYPNCMTYRHGYLAAGGGCGELEVKCLHTDSTIYKGSIADGTVNNALHIANLSGSLHLLVCNNDNTVKVMSLPRMETRTIVRSFVPVNYTAASPDGTKLCCVSDCSSTSIYQLRESGVELVSTLCEADDAGMGCGWSACGGLVASAHQDGTMCAWDVRSGGVVFKQRSRSPCRCLKFSPGPLDLLALTHHEEQVTLLDIRQWKACQHINAAQDSCVGGGGQGIAGIAFTNTGRRLYLGLEDWLAVCHIDHVARRSFPTAAKI